MLTPKLEELILCGKAFFKTAVIGGSKTTIDIDNDRFIIITDITYLPYSDTVTYNSTADNMQLSIYGERGFNHYIFRNKQFYSQIYYDGVGTGQALEAQMCNPQVINTYLLHTTQVGFSFILNNDNILSTIGIAPANNPAFAPPLDYGKDGITGAVNVDLTVQSGALLNQVVDRLGGLGIGTAVTQQIQFEAKAGNKPIVNANRFYPIANINYVEILGLPNNIGI